MYRQQQVFVGWFVEQGIDGTLLHAALYIIPALPNHHRDQSTSCWRTVLRRWPRQRVPLRTRLLLRQVLLMLLRRQTRRAMQ